MKFGELINSFINNLKIKNFINYNALKTEINSKKFISLLEVEINKYNNNYKNLILSKYEPYDTYTNLLINYLSINKILKKFKKNNNDNYVIFEKKYKSVDNFISKYSFYNDIINIPVGFNYTIDKTCPICLDKCNFPITTQCNHTYCWKCLVNVNKNFDFCPYCKTDTYIDPAMIILNTLVDCHKKYSPFKNNIVEKFHIVSDLHIDQWSHKYTSKYPCGQIKECPFKFTKSENDYLIVAGDISDDLNISINYLNEISVNYKKIFFVDGNHEHVHKYPQLYDKTYINNLVNNEKIVYLPSNPYIINKTVFIGCCGWWDYNNENEEVIENNTKYFKDWIKNFSREDNLEFINNVIQKSKDEFQYLYKLLQNYDNNSTIDNIIIVTHTVPHIKYCENKSVTDDSGSQLNTKFEKLFKFKKLSKWIFGHTHTQHEGKIYDVEIICNPRGRPEDFNRENYIIKKINL